MGEGSRPFPSAVYRTLRDLASPATLIDADTVYAITPAYYLDHEDTYQYRKQIPASIPAGKSIQLTIQLGEGVAPEDRRHAEHVSLRLGFRDLPANASLRVRINGQPLTAKDGAASFIQATGKAHKTAAGVFWQAPIPADLSLHAGENTIEIEWQTREGDAADTAAELVEVRLALLYGRPYLKLLFSPADDKEVQ